MSESSGAIGSSEHSPPTTVGGGSSNAETPNINLDHPQQFQNTARKSRGRPKGSKNKPKPPIVTTKDNDSTKKPVILEIAPGSDVIENIISFAVRNHVGVSIISATGSVSSLTLRQPSSHAPPLPFHGPFVLLSLSGSFIANDGTPQSSPCSSFGVTLVGAQPGYVFGGIVGGKLIAATQVIVVAITFSNAAFHKLPSEGGDNEDHHSVDGGAIEYRSSSGMSMGGYGVLASSSPFNCQIMTPWVPSSSRPY